MPIEVGDTISMIRTYSDLNGYSIARKWSGKLAEVLEVEDRINGAITVECENTKLLIFRDAVECIVEKHNRTGIPGLLGGLQAQEFE